MRFPTIKKKKKIQLDIYAIRKYLFIKQENSITIDILYLR